MASAVVDTAYVAAEYSVPESTVQSLLTAPTVELITTFLQQVIVKAQEFEALRQEKLKIDVELESAVHTSENRARQLRESVDKGLKEIETLRRQLNDSENARQELDTQLQDLKSSSSTSSSEVELLRSRIDGLETSNRDTIALLDRKSAAHDALGEELTAQQLKISALRREVAELEEKIQKAERDVLNAKLKEQSVQQELGLMKKNNEWYEDELKRRTADHAKFRKEKNAKVAELQRENEDATQTIESLRRTETNLRHRIEEVTRKAEEALAQIQTLQDEAAKAQDSFRVQLETSQRLAELQKQSAESARTRLKEVQAGYDKIKEDAADEIGRLQSEVDSERTDRETMDRKVVELELQLETLQAELEGARQPSVPATPRGMNGHGTPNRPGSPAFFSPGSARLKSGLSMTQLYSEHAQMKVELENERRRNEKLSKALDDMIQDLEQKQPEIEELTHDHERLQGDVEELSALLEETTKDRDEARKHARHLEGQTSGLTKEADLLRQQLRDLSAQIKILLVEAQAQEQGLESLSREDQLRLEQAAQGEIEVPQLEGMTDTSALISRRLVIFRNVQELQAQNVQLLNLTRKLGDEMEGEEARAKRNQQEQDQKELEELRDQNARYQDELRSLTVRTESYIRERDMFRRMLQSRGQLPPEGDATGTFDQSVSSAVLGASIGSVDPAQTAALSQDLADHRKLLKEMQAHFDAYRQEAATDHSALKQQIDRLGKEKADLQAEVAKLSSQLALARERYELLQSNYNMSRSENEELQKRSNYLSEVAAKQDLRTQQVAEELVESKEAADGLRNENANLKAERELWRRMEDRQTEDNQRAIEERSRLNKMISDLQSLQNERELSESENRRRLQSRVETLESELKTNQRKLDEALEENKKASLRRDYEQEQSRTRVDDLVKSLNLTREELVAIKTQRDHAQARVDELKIDLRNAEEKAQALQPRLTSRPTSGNTTDAPDQENQLSPEQELAVQVADLKRDLELAKHDLLQANEHVEQYKAISQAAEEQLQSATETQEQYQEQVDAQLSDKDTKIKDLERRVEEISEALSEAITELSNLRSKQDDNAKNFADAKATLESELGRLRDENERLAETSNLHQADLKAQAEIARKAQQNYDEELVKHAEAAQSLQQLRTNFNTVKTEVAGYKAEAEAAKVTLQQNEETWLESKHWYEQELTEQRNRYEELSTQNRRLHEQFESMSIQVAALKQNRDAALDRANDGTGTVDSAREDIITFLRREKDIAEYQLHLAQENVKGLEQRLQRTQTELEQSREKLNLERQSQTDREQTTLSQSRVLEELNQLNLFRDSNAQLREETRKTKAQLIEKTKEVESLTAQLEPLKGRVGELEIDVENKDGQIKLLEEDRDRWQKRQQDILQKYDRVDPAEMEALKTQITTLQDEKERLASEKETLQTRVDAIPAEIAQAEEESKKVWEDRRQKLIESAKNKAREQNGIIREKTQQLETTSQEKEKLSEELQATKAELETTKETLARQPSVPPTAPAAPTEGPTAEQVASAEEERKRADGLQQEVQRLQGRIEELESQVNDLQTRLDATSNELQSAKAAPLSNGDADANDATARIQTLESELNTARDEIQKLQNRDTTDIVIDTDERVKARITELEAEHQKKMAEVDENLKTRGEKLRKQLQEKLNSARETNAQEKAALQAEIDNLKTQHAAEIERLNKEHAEEVQNLKSQIGQPAANAGEAASAAEAPTPAVKAETLPTDWWQKLDDAQSRELVKNNNTIKGIIKNNILSKVKSEVEATKQTYEQQMEELKKSHQSDKENAVTLEAKRQSVKFTMADNRGKAAQAKLDVVQNAATTSPERPVGEVWEIAKNAKPVKPTPPANTDSTAQAAAGKPIAPPAPAPTVPTATPATTPAGPVRNGPAIAGQPTSAATPLQIAPPVFGQPTFGAPSATPFGQPSIPTGQATQTAPQAGNAAGLPPKPPQAFGTGPKALAGVTGRGGSGIPRGGHQQQGSNIPVPGAANRGSGIPRGGQRGGRGGRTASRGGGNQGGPNSPGGMNPSARQFIPGGAPAQAGNKRPHETGQTGNAEKRPKSDADGQ